MMVQSVTGEDMEKQGITTLEDFSRFVAGLSVQTTTPGQNTIGSGALAMAVDS